MSSAHAKHDHDAHRDPLVSYVLVFLALMALLALTVWAYTIPFETYHVAGIQLTFMNTVVALCIASVKAMLVMLVFMHLRHGSKLLVLIAIAGFLWLGIMASFTFSDYLSRSAISESLKQPLPNVPIQLPDKHL